MDASWSMQGAGIGLFYDHKKDVSVAFTKLLEHTSIPEQVETIAIREGFKIADKSIFHIFILRVIVKVYLISVLHVQGLSLLGHIHGQMVSLIDKLSASISFVRRDANIPTHILTNHVAINFSVNI